MAVRNFNDAEKQKLIQIISQGSQVLGEVDDLIHSGKTNPLIYQDGKYEI